MHPLDAGFMHVAVVGAGAVGSLFAARLAAAGTEVSLLARDQAAADAARGGIAVLGHDPVTARVSATTDPDALGDFDALLLAVKATDTGAAMGTVAPACEDGTDVVTLQNGLGNAETIAEHVPRTSVVAGTTAHGATLLAPGRVRHAGTGPTRIGRPFAASDARVRALAETFTTAGFETSVVADVRDAIWEKVAVNAGINAATALADVDNEAMVATAPGSRLLSAAVEEVVTVARASGRRVPDDTVERARTVARETGANVSSMRADLRAGARTEVEAIHGAVVDRGERHGVAVPVNRTLADLVRLAEGRYSGAPASETDT